MTLNPNHYGLAPCHEQPGRQQWHLACALRHPVTFVRTRSTLGLDHAPTPQVYWQNGERKLRR